MNESKILEVMKKPKKIVQNDEPRGHFFNAKNFICSKENNKESVKCMKVGKNSSATKKHEKNNPASIYEPLNKNCSFRKTRSFYTNIFRGLYSGFSFQYTNQFKFLNEFVY